MIFQIQIIISIEDIALAIYKQKKQQMCSLFCLYTHRMGAPKSISIYNSIPDIWHLLGTIALLRPVKGAPKMPKLTKKTQNIAFCVQKKGAGLK